jgi:hypothetical protein
VSKQKEAVEKMFDEKDIISVYTDEQAVEDGVLVSITTLGMTYCGIAIDRMTGTSFEYFHKKASGKQNELEAMKQAIAEKVGTAYDPDGDGYLIVIPEKGDEGRLWLVKNERNNYTMMFPSEY